MEYKIIKNLHNNGIEMTKRVGQRAKKSSKSCFYNFFVFKSLLLRIYDESYDKIKIK